MGFQRHVQWLGSSSVAMVDAMVEQSGQLEMFWQKEVQYLVPLL